MLPFQGMVITKQPPSYCIFTGILLATWFSNILLTCPYLLNLLPSPTPQLIPSASSHCKFPDISQLLTIPSCSLLVKFYKILNCTCGIFQIIQFYVLCNISLVHCKCASSKNSRDVYLQALDEKSLRLLNRDHNVKDAVRCTEVARQLFPGRASMDLIFGRPYQTKERFVISLITCN